jgi:hypothetical protein
MKFRVFEMETNKDVTNEEDWYIDTDGDLRYITADINKVGFPLAIANGDYYYKLEIEVV